MAKVFLRNNKRFNGSLNPYVLETDAIEDINPLMFGEIYIRQMFVDRQLLIGIGRDEKICLPLGTAQYGASLTQRVYDVSLEFGKKVARCHANRLEFVDETCGPRLITLLTL